MRAVDHLVRAARPLDEADDVAGLELALALRRPKRRRAGDDHEPLLVAVLVVVGPRSLARRQLVERGSDLGGVETRADAGHPPVEAVRPPLVLPLVAVEVEDLHDARSYGPE
jgi:hypothetical protein